MNNCKSLLNIAQQVRILDPRMEMQTLSVFLYVGLANYNNGHKGVTSKHIASALNIAQSSTSRNVFRLSDTPNYNKKKDGTFKQNLGFLRYEDDPTFRRRKLYFVTELGMKVINKLTTNEDTKSSIGETSQNKLRDLKSAADYLGLKEYALKNIFYRIYNRKQPQPTYLGDRLYFTTKALDNLVELNTHIAIKEQVLNNNGWGLNNQNWEIHTP